MQTFRILVADNHEIARLGVRAVLSSHPEWEICGEAANGEELITEVEKARPDIVVTELAMRDAKGRNAVREILRRIPDQKILALTYCDSENLAQQALEAGVRGLLWKSDPAVELRAAIEAISHGALYFTRRISEMLLQRFRQVSGPNSKRARYGSRLTTREKEILRAIACGQSNRKISEALGLTPKTVESHRTNIMRKLDLHSVSEVVLYALRNNVLMMDNHEQELFSVHRAALESGPNTIDSGKEHNDKADYAVVAASSAVA